MNNDIQRIISGEIEINHQQKKQLDKLIDEFRDELFLIEQAKRIDFVSSKINSLLVNNAWRGRFLTELKQYVNHPAISESTRWSNMIYFSYAPASANFQADVGLRALSSSKNILVDEAYIKLLTPAQVTIGRQYFLLDRLGLLADNFFDAFEAIRLDYKNFTVVYSRLSTTNYPYSKIFVSKDDYCVFRISDIKTKGWEVGLTYLASGIASERGAGVDFHTTIAEENELVGEFAVYWPSKTDYTASPDAKLSAILGLDLYKTHNTNIFLQIGSVEKGFTPMASSLIYSAGCHLYFDQDTLGGNITFTYQPNKQKELTPWETRIDRRGYFTPLTIWEAEFVWFVRQDLLPHSSQYIFRYIQPIGRGLSLHFENIYWVRKNTILHPNTNYNQTKVTVSFNF